MIQTFKTKIFNHLLVLLGFADKTQDITVSQIEEGDGSWYMGKYEAKGVVIEMEEKK